MMLFCFEPDAPDERLGLKDVDEKFDLKRCFGLKELEFPPPNLLVLLNCRLETKFTSVSSSENAGVKEEESSGCCCC